MPGQEAKIIDLEDFRRRRERRERPAPTGGAQVVWMPVWVWVPLWTFA